MTKIVALVLALALTSKTSGLDASASSHPPPRGSKN